MMTVFIFILYHLKVNTNFTIMLNISTHLLLLVWIGQETLDILELLIKLMQSNSMMLKNVVLSRKDLNISLIQLFGRQVHVNLVGKLWVFSHKVLMELM